MNIELHEVLIRELIDQYTDNDESGVFGYCGKLNIRPPYQRNFIYSDEKQKAVINTIRKRFPINIMYWVKADDGHFELMDGQQRTISICKYYKNEFSVEINEKLQYFHNLTKEEKDEFLNYHLLVYWCEGTQAEVLDWFKTINIAGLELKEQEMLNATHTGPWLSHAKPIFSKSNCPAYLLSKDYVRTEVDRQRLLEIALKWISKNKVEDYMNIHQHDPNANEMWMYFQNVINWVSMTFISKYAEMKGVDWGALYDDYHDTMIDTTKLDIEINKLMEDDEITNTKGIFSYVLTRKEKFLNLREFTPVQKRVAYNKQNGICPHCKNEGRSRIKFSFVEMEADHINPWHLGGKTIPDNLQMLCLEHNRTKGGK